MSPHKLFKCQRLPTYPLTYLYCMHLISIVIRDFSFIRMTTVRDVILSYVVFDDFVTCKFVI